MGRYLFHFTIFNISGVHIFNSYFVSLILISSIQTIPLQETATMDLQFELDSSTTIINNETLLLVNCSRFSDENIQTICEDCYTFQYECPYGESDNNNITCSRNSGWNACATCSICKNLPSLYPSPYPELEVTTGSASTEGKIRLKRQANCITKVNGACGSGPPCCAALGLSCQSTSAGRGNRRKTCRYA